MKQENWPRYFEAYAKTQFPSKLESDPWNYKHDLCMLGLDALYTATGQACYLQAMLDARPYLLGDTGKIRHFSENEYNLDTISFGKSLLLLYKRTQDARFLDAAMRCYGHLKEYPRTKSGGFYHKDIYPHQIWLDGLYMAQPFAAACEVQRGTFRFDDILRQFAGARAHLYVAETELYLHAWDESRTAAWADPETGLSPSYWLRAEGWLLMALCDCYELISAHTPRAALLSTLLDEALSGLLPYRDKQSGMFLQVIDRAGVTGNYPETSGSAMVAYALLKGARLGMIDKRYAQTGAELLKSIGDTCLREESGALRLDHICASAGLGPGPDNRPDRDGTVRYYLSEAQIPDNEHGSGACMLAYAEALRAEGADA